MISTSSNAAVGYAHSKLILIGEHAVVYGKPAIAIPFPLEAKSTIKEKTGEILIDCPLFTGPINKMPVKLRGLTACIKETLQYLKKPLKGLHISIHSSIPLGRGLGSSAAIATAIVRSLFSFFGKAASHQELMELVEIAEVYAHGTPSGIDMAAVSSSLPIWFQKGKEVIPLETAASLNIVVADTGRIGDTRTAVKNVRDNFSLLPDNMQTAIERVEKIAMEAKSALLNGNSSHLGRLLDENHSELIKLGVSDDGLNRLVEAARNAGALGAKLTGGGLGGCMIALAQSLGHAKLIASELRKAGANKTWHFTTEY